MPRDFVPCLYEEQDMYDISRDVWQRRYQVIECFALMEIASRQSCVSLTRNSHAFYVGESQTPEERRALLPHGSAFIDQRARARLFDTFYAAMAALE